MRDAAPALRHRRLPELVLPGSYNAGAVDLHSITVLGFGRRWANTQRHSVAAQLRAGIRYLDLHVQYLHVEGASGPYLVHTPAGGIATFFGQSLTELMSDVLSFLRQHPREVVIVHLSRFYDMTPARHAHLAELLRTWTGERVVLPTALASTVGELWAVGRQLVVLYGDDYCGGGGRTAALAAWPALWDAQATCDSAPPLPPPLLTPLTVPFEAALQARDPARLGVLRGTWTVTAGAMLRGYLRPHQTFTDRAQIAAHLNPLLLRWLRCPAARTVNVLALDYATDSELPPSLPHRRIVHNATRNATAWKPPPKKPCSAKCPR